MHQPQIFPNVLASCALATGCTLSSEPLGDDPPGAGLMSAEPIVAHRAADTRSPGTGSLPVSDCIDVDGFAVPPADVARVILLPSLPPDDAITYRFELSNGTKALPLSLGCAIDVPGGPATATLSREGAVVTTVPIKLASGATTVAVPWGDAAAPSLLFDPVDNSPTAAGRWRIALTHIARDAQTTPTRVIGSDNFLNPTAGTQTVLVDALGFGQRVVIDAPPVRSMIFDRAQDGPTGDPFRAIMQNPDACGVELHMPIICLTPNDGTNPCGPFGPGGGLLVFRRGCR